MQATGLTTAQEDILYDWIYSVLNPLGVSILWEYPEEFEQAKPHCILSIPTKPVNEHKPSLEYVAQDTFNYRFHDVFTFSVKIYDNDGNNYLKKVVRSQYYNAVVEMLQSAGLVCRYKVSENFLPELVNEKFEYRRSADFIMAYSEVEQQTIAEINTVEVTANIVGTVDAITRVKIDIIN